MRKKNGRINYIGDNNLMRQVGTTHRFSHNIGNPANKALSEMGTFPGGGKY